MKKHFYTFMRSETAENGNQFFLTRDVTFLSKIIVIASFIFFFFRMATNVNREVESARAATCVLRSSFIVGISFAGSPPQHLRVPAAGSPRTSRFPALGSALEGSAKVFFPLLFSHFTDLLREFLR